MTFDEIEDCFPPGAISLEDGWTGVTAQWLHDFARTVAAKERDECAKVCDDVRDQDASGGNDSYLEGRRMGATVCMNKIRMRSNKG